MKIIYAITISLMVQTGMSALHAQAQFYPDSLANWCLRSSASPAGGSFIMHMVANPDTLINEVSYKRVEPVLFTGTVFGPPFPRYYIRSLSDGSGYIYIPALNEEFKTGNVSAAVGDTVRDVLVWDNTLTCEVLVDANLGLALAEVVVLGIDTITAQGVTVVRHSVWPLCSDVFEPTFWQAGIGTEHGPLMLITPGLAHIYLGEASVGDTCYYDRITNPMGLPGGPSCCWYTDVNGITEGVAGQHFSIRPNPTPGRITVEFPDPLLRDSYFSVFDPTGRLLYQRPLPAGATLEEVDLSRFGRGTYVIRVTDPEGVRHERVLCEP
jgi:hypothetical protein